MHIKPNTLKLKCLGKYSFDNHLQANEFYDFYEVTLMEHPTITQSVLNLMLFVEQWYTCYSLHVFNVKGSLLCTLGNV